MSEYGNGSWDRVQVPEILMATLSNSASESTLAKSANGSAGGGGSKACTCAQMIDHDLGVWMAASQLTQQRQLARTHDIYRKAGFGSGGEYAVEAGMVRFVRMSPKT